MLMFYNSLTRKKEAFVPREPQCVGLYVCGVTVYDRCHLGHARSMVCFDVLVRYLRFLDYDVIFVRNITDIDDKIIARAHERSVSIQALTEENIEALHADAKALMCLPPTHEPRATAHIANMLRLIERLFETGHAYLSADGDVCYQVDRFAAYGQLSHQALDGLLAGARVDAVATKRSPLDFVLWKKAKPGEPYWPSPWGDGRPGWHIECSAMAMDALGEEFDIHGGGLDLQFPHHENELAQSEGATGKTFANYWLHVGLLQVEHEKMSKSLGNFFTIESVLREHHPEVVRYFLLSSQYRSSLNYSTTQLLSAGNALARLYQSLKDVVLGDTLDESWVDRFNATMCDDLNTPMAMAVLFQLSHELNKTKSSTLAATLVHLGGVLGLLQAEPQAFLQGRRLGLDTDDIAQQVALRTEARAQRDWAKADEIRQSLLAQGIEIEDSAQGTTWRVI